MAASHSLYAFSEFRKGVDILTVNEEPDDPQAERTTIMVYTIIYVFARHFLSFLVLRGR